MPRTDGGWTHIGWEDAMHKMVRMAGVHVEERGGRKSGGDASAQGGEDDPVCRRKCWISSSKHKANDVEGEEYKFLGTGIDELAPCTLLGTSSTESTASVSWGPWSPARTMLH